MARLIGIDVGTSATKVVLINERGDVLKSASRDYPLLVPKPGWAEQDPLDWLRATHACLSEIGERKPDAIGITGQMHGMVALDSHDAPVRNAILWCDQRTADECVELDDTLGALELRARTCNPPMTGFQIPKVLWLRNNEPHHFERTRSILLPKDFVRLALTKVKATDVSDASGTGVFDVPQRTWWREAVSRLRLDADMFPECFESATVSSTTVGSDVLEAGIPVVSGAGDQAAGAVGTGTVAPGIVSVSLGTSGVVFACTESPLPDPSGAVNVFCHANDSWHAMGVMLSCGGAVKWARDTLFPELSFRELDEVASLAPIGCDGAAMLPYLSGERCPHNDPLAKGAIVGLHIGLEKRHIARAVMEGVSFGLRDCFELVSQNSTDIDEVRVTGGGSKSAFWMQMLADVFQLTCVRIKRDEGPAVGAAMLAGVGIGLWKSVREASSAVVRLGDRFVPTSNDYDSTYQRYKALYPRLKV